VFVAVGMCASLGVWVSLTPPGNTLLLCFLNAHSNQSCCRLHKRPSLTPLLQQTDWALHSHTLSMLSSCLTVPYVKLLTEMDWWYFRWEPKKKP